jgi:hypothetical protein
VFRTVRHLPWFRVLAIAKLALTARRHLRNLSPAERRRMAVLARRGRSLDDRERDELRGLVSRLDTRNFAAAAADAFSPFPVGRFVRRG